MPKGSPQLTAAREEEIVNACERLYSKMCFKDITMLHISQEKSFTRTSIYNYFQTKEEIFLALFKKEYDRWLEDLQALIKQDIKDPCELSDMLSKSIQNRGQLLKLLSMNVYDMEAHSRPEMLYRFKVSFIKTINAVKTLFERVLPDKETAEKSCNVFFPFMNGIYPYCYSTPKQAEAMKKAGFDAKPYTVYGLAHLFLSHLLQSKGYVK